MNELQPGTKMAIFFWSKDEAGEDDVARLVGTLAQDEAGYFLDRGASGRFDLRDEWLARIKVPGDSMQGLVQGAGLMLSPNVGRGDAGPDGEWTGLSWPRD